MSLIDQASWVMVPSQYEEDWVRAFKPTSTLGDLAFTRSSDATFTDSTGVVRRSPWNLVTFSEQFENAAWTKDRVTVTANVTTAPNGTTTADKVVDTLQGNSAYRIYNSATLSAISYTASFYVKAAEYSWVYIRIGNSLRVWFNVTTGVVGGADSGIAGRIENAGNGWYRCTAIITTATAGGGFALLGLTNANNVESYTPTTGGQGVFVWGAQLVEGTEALPYFATTDRLNVPRLDYRNADGTLSTCPRLLLEPQRTNSIRNSSMVGATSGGFGTLPTNWTTSTRGLTQTIVGTGVINGLPYIDLRFSGTANATTALQIFPESTTQIVAASGQSWTGSVWAQVISQPSPSSAYNLVLSERTAIGAQLALSSTTFGTSFVRSTLNRTLTNALTERISWAFHADVVNATAYDFTIRIAAPQMELGAYATTWVPTTTAAVTRVRDAFTRSNIYTNGFISPAGGTWFVDLSNVLSYTRDNTNGILLGDSVNQNAGNQFIIRSPTSARLNILVLVGGVSVAIYTLPADACKIAIKWNGTNVEAFVNGVKRITATSFTTTVMQNIAFDAGVPFSINQMLLAPTPLSDAECIALTTL